MSPCVAWKRAHPGCGDLDEDRAIARDRCLVRRCARGQCVGLRGRHGVKGERISLEHWEGVERLAIVTSRAPPIGLSLQDPAQPLGGPPPEDEVE